MSKDDDDLVVEIFGTLNLRFKHLNPPSVYYEVGWDESFCLVSCKHKHATITEAAKCRMTMPAGSFVFAVEDGTPRLGGGKFRFSKVK